MMPFFLGDPLVQQKAIRRLEQELDIAFCLLQTMADRMRAALGPDALGPQLNRFLVACDPIAQGAFISRLDNLVIQKQESEAVKQFRELLGITWDQAFDLYRQWSHCDRGQKLRWLRASELHKIFTPPGDHAV